MYFTKPKPSKSPSMSVGEQEEGGFSTSSSSTSYPGGGVAGTAYNGDKCITKELSGGSGSPAKATYPKGKPTKFGTESGM